MPKRGWPPTRFLEPPVVADAAGSPVQSNYELAPGRGPDGSAVACMTVSAVRGG